MLHSPWIKIRLQILINIMNRSLPSPKWTNWSESATKRDWNPGSSKASSSVPFQMDERFKRGCTENKPKDSFLPVRGFGARGCGYDKEIIQNHVYILNQNSSSCLSGNWLRQFSESPNDILPIWGQVTSPGSSGWRMGSIVAMLKHPEDVPALMRMKIAEYWWRRSLRSAGPGFSCWPYCRGFSASAV